jgi:hypothetical protein
MGRYLERSDMRKKICYDCPVCNQQAGNDIMSLAVHMRSHGVSAYDLFEKLGVGSGSGMHWSALPGADRFDSVWHYAITLPWFDEWFREQAALHMLGGN